MAERNCAPASSPRTKRCCARRWSTCCAHAWPELEIVAECEDGASALEAIAEHQPDVAFLDIRMPGLTGLEVAAAAAQASPRTQIVFVTAYDQYAIDAFERGAVDYLLKPISRRAPGRDGAARCRRASASADAEALAATARAARRPRCRAAAGDAAADLAHRQHRPRDAPDPGRRRRLFPRRQQVHDGDDRRRRSAAAQADPRTAGACSTRRRSSRSTARPSSTSRRSPASSATTAAAARCA